MDGWEAFGKYVTELPYGIRQLEIVVGNLVHLKCHEMTFSVSLDDARNRLPEFVSKYFAHQEGLHVP